MFLLSVSAFVCSVVQLLFIFLLSEVLHYVVKTVIVI